MARRFHPLRIVDIRRETSDTLSLALEIPPDLADEFAFTAGQFLTFRVAGADGVPVERSYSICTAPTDGELRVVVKRLEGGVFGEWAHRAMAVGDLLPTLPPLGRFTVPLDPANEKRYLTLASGSGISPVMSILRAVLGTEPAAQVTLVYGNRTSDSVIFRDAIADLKDRYLDRLDVLHLFSREQQDVALLNGRVTPAKLHDLNAHLLDVTTYDEVFVCGPEPMTLGLRTALIELGVPPDHVHLELYGSHLPKPPRASGADHGDVVGLEIVLGGTRRRVEGRYDETVLDAAAAAGLDVPYSCTGGVCATCRARVLDGSVDMAVNYSLQQWELDAGFVLTCQSRPTTVTVTVDYDAV